MTTLAFDIVILFIFLLNALISVNARQSLYTFLSVCTSACLYIYLTLLLEWIHICLQCTPTCLPLMPLQPLVFLTRLYSVTVFIHKFFAQDEL